MLTAKAAVRRWGRNRLASHAAPRQSGVTTEDALAHRRATRHAPLLNTYEEVVVEAPESYVRDGSPEYRRVVRAWRRLLEASRQMETVRQPKHGRGRKEEGEHERR